MLTVSACAVKNAAMTPVALATLATLKSISAQRTTNVSPTAMIPVTDISERMFLRLSSDANLGLAMLKNTKKREQHDERSRRRAMPFQCPEDFLEASFEDGVLRQRIHSVTP